MNENEIAMIYEYAAALMPNDGKWNKPTSAAEIVAHTHALRNLPFPLACLATELLMTQQGKWPAPWELLRVGKEISADLSLEKAEWAYGSEMEAATAAVTEVAQIALMANDSVREAMGDGSGTLKSLSK
jgi:hypothetical protein